MLLSVYLTFKILPFAIRKLALRILLIDLHLLFSFFQQYELLFLNNLSFLLKCLRRRLLNHSLFALLDLLFNNQRPYNFGIFLDLHFDHFR